MSVLPNYIPEDQLAAFWESRQGQPLTGSASGTRLPRQSDEELMEFLGTAMGQPVALAYGRHLVAGVPAFQEVDGTDTITFRLLGDGPWDSIEVLWINAVSKSLPDTTLVHFHPGLDGVDATESTPSTPNQERCSKWPVGYTALTFSRTAYLGLTLPDDPYGPGPEFDIRGIYKTRQVRIFDGDGVETSFEYSANPLWQFLDAYISLVLMPHAEVDAPLTPEAAARIDFGAFYDSAAYADESVADGNRFESHVAFARDTDFSAIIDTFLALTRGYLREPDGKLALFIDQPRASVFSFTGARRVFNSLSLPAKNPRQQVNRLVIQARDLESGGGDATKDFDVWSKQLDRETHQDFINRVNKQEMDLGANTQARSIRLGDYWLDRSLIDDQARIFSTLDAGGLAPGDVVHLPADFTNDLEAAITSGMLTNNGFASFTAALCVDGLLFAEAFSTASVAPGSTIEIDLGSGNAQTIRGLMLYSLGGGVNVFGVDYSDNGSAWTDAEADFTARQPRGWYESGGIDAGSHRWWRLRLSAVSDGGGSFSELVLIGDAQRWEVLEATDEPDDNREIFVQKYDEEIFPD